MKLYSGVFYMLILLVYSSLSAQENKPIFADFGISGLTYNTSYTLEKGRSYTLVNKTVNFCATESYTWSITPSSGTTISSTTARNPTISFSQPGNYTLKLNSFTAKAPGFTCASSSSSKTVVIRIISNTPVAQFNSNGSSSDKTIALNSTVSFTDQSSNSPTSWQWSISPGSGWAYTSGNASSKNPTVRFTGLGKYSVSLKAANADGNDTETKSNHITVNAVAPVADFKANGSTGSAINIAQNAVVKFEDMSTNNPTSWAWAISPASGWSYSSGSSGSEDAQVKFTLPGTYSVSLTASNSGGSNKKTKTNLVVVATAPPSVSDPNINYCLNETSIALKATGTNLKWYTSATSSFSSSSAPRPSTSTIGTFRYYVSQTINNKESDRVLITVVIKDIPGRPTAKSAVFYCVGSAATRLTASGTNLKWYVNSNTTTPLSNAPLPNTAVEGTTIYYVAQTNANGCEGARTSVKVVVSNTLYPPDAFSKVNYTIGDVAVPLIAVGNNLLWYETAVGGTGSVTPPTPSTATIGKKYYYVSQTLAGCGESARAVTEVIVSAVPPVLLPPPTTQATNISFTGTSGSLNWTKGNGQARLVFVSQTENGAPVPIDGTSYIANPSFGEGAEIGDSGWYCVYNGTGTNVSIAKLNPETNYRAMVVEYNNLEAGFEKYLSTPSAGNPLNFTTEALFVDLTLKSLSLSSGSLDPAFDPLITTYSVIVPYLTTSLQLSAATTEATTNLTINGNAIPSGSSSGDINLVVGNNMISLVVTAPNGKSSKTYTINVKREAIAPTATLSDITISRGILSPSFDPDIADYKIVLEHDMASISVISTTTDPNATISIGGNVAATGSHTTNIALSIGNNVCPIVVTASDGTTKTYKLTILRKAAIPEARLSSLGRSQGIISPEFSPNVYSYTIEVANLTSKISVNPVPTQPEAEVTIDGIGRVEGLIELSLKEGENRLNVVVTSSDGKIVSEYKFLIFRNFPAPVPDLISLKTSAGTLSPAFERQKFNYALALPHDISSIKFTPATNQANYSIFVAGIRVTSGAASQSIELPIGKSTIKIEVKDAANKTGTYSITVDRASAPAISDKLATVSIYKGVFSPAFHPDITSYTVVLDQSVGAFSSISQVTIDPKAFVSVNGGQPGNDPVYIIGLNPGDNMVTIKVTSSDGLAFRTYTFRLIRNILQPHKGLSALHLSSGTLMPSFNPEIVSYTATVSNNISNLNIAAVAAEINAGIAIAGIGQAAGSVDVPLNEGNNEIPIVVVSINGLDRKEYKLSVYREFAQTKPLLSGLSLNYGTLSPGFSPSIQHYTATVSSNISAVIVNPSANQLNGIITVNGIEVVNGTSSNYVPLNPGINTVNISVTAPDGMSTSYTIQITKQGTVIPTAALSSLLLSQGTINPVFSTNIADYVLEVPATVSSITLTPISTEQTATILINGINVTSGTQSGSYPLNTGENIIKIVVTSSNTATTKTYTLTVNRAEMLPIISSVVPLTGKTGTLVTIAGSGFTPATTIKFGDTMAASANIASETSITAIVGAGASGDLSVTTEHGTSSFPGFKFVPLPTIVASGPTTFLTGGNVSLTASPGGGYTYQWFRNGVMIPDAKSYLYSATASGDYSVSITLNSVEQTSVPISVNSVFGLSANNFKISTMSTTCKGSANGIISISAAKNLNYIASVSNNNVVKTYPFTTVLDISTLIAGTYSVCITVEGQPGFKQCFTTVVSEPKDLSVYTSVKPGNEIELSMNGATTYHVTLNGVKYTTDKNKLLLPLSNGKNSITVTTDKDCQGMVEKNIIHSEELIAYPNPFHDVINLRLGEKHLNSVKVNIYDTNMSVVFSAQYSQQSGILPLDLSALKNGLFMLKLTTDSYERIIKIIKK